MTTAHATVADIEPIGKMLARAFLDDPVQQWLFAGAPDLEAALGDLMGFFTERYFAIGHVYEVPGSAGAALWGPPDRHALGIADVEPLTAMVARAIGDAAEARLGELGRTFDYLPPDEPYVYLGVIGVDPARHGTGLGTALMEPGLNMADDGGFATHLESSNPRNIAFYRRHGFEEIGHFSCGGSGPVMTAMRREPR